MGDLTGCWKCETPLLVWDAQSQRSGGPVPDLEVKDAVGAKRFENHPEVHKIVNEWVAAAGADIGKACIEKRRSKAKAEEYSAFVCPKCGTIIGQFFISKITQDKWSLIGAPERKPQQPRRPKPQRRPPAPQSVIVLPARPEPKPVPAKDFAPKLTWEQLHSKEGVEAARRQFRGTTS